MGTLIEYMIRRFREHTPYPEHDLVQALARYRHDWEAAARYGVSDHEGMVRMLRVLPEAWRPWARSRMSAYAFRDWRTMMIVHRFPSFFGEVIHWVAEYGFPPEGPYIEVTDFPVIGVPDVTQVIPPIPEPVQPTPPSGPTAHVVSATVTVPLPDIPVIHPEFVGPSSPLPHTYCSSSSLYSPIRGPPPLEPLEQLRTHPQVPHFAAHTDGAHVVIEISSDGEPAGGEEHGVGDGEPVIIVLSDSEDQGGAIDEDTSDDEVVSVIDVPDDTVVIDSDDGPEEGDSVDGI